MIFYYFLISIIWFCTYNISFEIVSFWVLQWSQHLPLFSFLFHVILLVIVIYSILSFFSPSPLPPVANVLGCWFKARRPSHVKCFISLSIHSLKWFSCCPHALTCLVFKQMHNTSFADLVTQTCIGLQNTSLGLWNDSASVWLLLLLLSVLLSHCLCILSFFFAPHGLTHNGGDSLWQVKILI